MFSKLPTHRRCSISGGNCYFQVSTDSKASSSSLGFSIPDKDRQILAVPVMLLLPSLGKLESILVIRFVSKAIMPLAMLYKEGSPSRLPEGHDTQC